MWQGMGQSNLHDIVFVQKRFCTFQFADILELMSPKQVEHCRDLSPNAVHPDCEFGEITTKLSTLSMF